MGRVVRLRWVMSLRSEPPGAESVGSRKRWYDEVTMLHEPNCNAWMRQLVSSSSLERAEGPEPLKTGGWVFSLCS